jgi:hypothetical protein
LRRSELQRNTLCRTNILKENRSSPAFGNFGNVVKIVDAANTSYLRKN